MPPGDGGWDRLAGWGKAEILLGDAEPAQGRDIVREGGEEDGFDQLRTEPPHEQGGIEGLLVTAPFVDVLIEQDPKPYCSQGWISLSKPPFSSSRCAPEEALAIREVIAGRFLAT
jgi:hypothetical protein